MSLPRLPKEVDGRFKCTDEILLKIIKMRHSGDTYSFIANKVGMRESGVYQAYRMATDPDWRERRKKQRREAQKKYHAKNKETKEQRTKRAISTKKKHLSVHKIEYLESESRRSLDYYRKNKEWINPRRNIRRRKSNRDVTNRPVP